MATIGKYNQIVLSSEEEKFLKDNFRTMTNAQLAKSLGLTLTVTRNYLYQFGLKRFEMEFWTDEQIEFLKANYQKKGDTELAEIFAEKWHKEKGWSKKHIEKKRRYLKLKRTQAEIKAIKNRHIKSGVYVRGNQKMWETRGAAAVGDVRIWQANNHPVMVIKTPKGFVDLSREIWKKHHGKIPNGMVVTVKDGNRLNLDIENLELITRAENAFRNRLGIFGMPPEIKRSAKLIVKLKKELKRHGHT